MQVTKESIEVTTNRENKHRSIRRKEEDVLWESSEETRERMQEKKERTQGSKGRIEATVQRISDLSKLIEINSTY